MSELHSQASSSPPSRSWAGWTLGREVPLLPPSGLSHWESQWAGENPWEGGGPELSLAISLSDFLPHCFPLTIPTVVSDGTSTNLGCFCSLVPLFRGVLLLTWLLFFLHRVFDFLLKSYVSSVLGT